MILFTAPSSTYPFFFYRKRKAPKYHVTDIIILNQPRQLNLTINRPWTFTRPFRLSVLVPLNLFSHFDPTRACNLPAVPTRVGTDSIRTFLRSAEPVLASIAKGIATTLGFSDLAN
jgi:hypothetical protein